jgi:hypothetical protein
MTGRPSIEYTFSENAQEQGRLAPVQIKVTVPADVDVLIEVEEIRVDSQETRQPSQPAAAPFRWQIAWEWAHLPGLLFGISIFIYLLVRLIGLTDYPGYFNFDEADPTILASDFLRDGYRNYAGELFPAFFPNPGGNFNVGSAAVYLQIAPLLLFGRSDYVIRATSVLLGLLGAICLALSLRHIFRLRYWWAGLLVLSAIPTWFHHSRTGYEMPTFVAFYSVMMYCYWLYRFYRPAYIYPALLAATVAFYDYSPGQALIPLSILVLFILDFPYHRRIWRTTLPAAGLGAVCGAQYVRFQLTHAGSTAETLSHVNSYWVQNIPLTEKIGTFLARYAYHLRPVYWFAPAYDVTPYDGLLHIMKGYGHLGLWLLPFMAWGLWLVIRRLRQSEYRTLLATLLVAPVSAALVTSPSSITRAMMMVIPAALMATIGLDDLLHKAVARFQAVKHTHTAAALLTVLCLLNAYMFWDVLTNGISWFDNNQSNGVQFGASKVFPALKEELKVTPNARAVISPEWAMMTHLVARLYLGDNSKISFASLYDYGRQIFPLETDTIFVVTPEEFEFARNNPKFSGIQILRTIPYSQTKAGFYLLRLEYSPQAEAILAAEEAERRKPLLGEVLIDEQLVQIVYTRNDGTLIESVFDDDPDSLYKSAEINPAIFELTFPQAREFRGLFIMHGEIPINLRVVFLSENGAEIGAYQASFVEGGTEGNTLAFDPVITASKVHIIVEVSSEKERGLVHIWDMRFK